MSNDRNKLQLNHSVRLAISGLPLGPFSTGFVNQIALIWNVMGDKKLAQLERQAMCELERISISVYPNGNRRKKFEATDECVIFAYRGGKNGKNGRLCPLDIWLKHGGSPENRSRGWYLKTAPREYDCHWHEPEFKRNTGTWSPEIARLFDMEDRGIPLDNKHIAKEFSMSGEARKDRTHKAQLLRQRNNGVFYSDFMGRSKSYERIMKDKEGELYGQPLADLAVVQFVKTFEKLMYLQAADAMDSLLRKLRPYFD